MPPSWLGGFRFEPPISSEPVLATYLLDTSAISALMRGDAGTASWLATLGADDRLVVCAIAGGETLFGIERLAYGRRRTDLEDKAANVVAVLPCEHIPPAAGDRHASVKISQQRRGLSVDRVARLA